MTSTSSSTLAPDEALKAVGALAELGLRPSVPVNAAGFANPEVRRSWIEEKGMQVFSMKDPANPLRHVDFFVEDVGFQGLGEPAVSVSLAGIDVRVAAIDDLIAMKRLAGRTQDLADIEALLLLRRPEDDAMSEPVRGEEDWAVSFEARGRAQLIRLSRETTPAQRLAWLEEMLELAHRVGARRLEDLVEGA